MPLAWGKTDVMGLFVPNCTKHPFMVELMRNFTLARVFLHEH